MIGGHELCPHCVNVPMIARTNGWGGEEWRPVPEFDALRYEVSNHGRVRRVHKDPRVALHKVLKPVLGPCDRRYMVTLSLGRGKLVRRSIHSLVAEAFIGPRPDGCEVNHMDGVWSHNCATNLEYVTPQRNKQHALETGLVPRGGAVGTAKLTESDVMEMRRRFADGESLNRIANAFGVSKGAACGAIYPGRWWTWLPYPAYPARRPGRKPAELRHLEANA